jgi:hypothetical protein
MAAGLAAQEVEVWRAYRIDGGSLRDVEKETGVSKSNVQAIADSATRKLKKALRRAKEEPNLGIEQEALLMRWSEIVEEERGSAEPRKDRWGHTIRCDSRGFEIIPDNPEN